MSLHRSSHLYRDRAGLRTLPRLSVTGLLALPGVYFAFKTEFLIENIVTVLSYGDLSFAEWPQ